MSIDGTLRWEWHYGDLPPDPNDPPNPWIWGFPVLPDGQHTAVAECNGSLGNFTKNYTIHSDNTAPTVRVASPLIGVVVGPYSISISGTANDGIGVGIKDMMAYLLHTRDPIDWARESVVPQLVGDQWSFELTPPFVGPANPDGTKDIPMVVEAVDFFTNANTSGHFSYTPKTSPAYFYFTVDDTPPEVAIINPSAGTIDSFSSIEGTASDNVALGSISLWIRERSTDKFWSGSEFVDTGGVPHLIDLPVSPGTVTNWSYSGLKAGDLVGGSSYTIMARAIDSVGVVSSTAGRTFTLSVEEHTLASEQINQLEVVFTPSNINISYGGTETVCLDIPEELKPRFSGRVEATGAQSLDIKVLAPGGPCAANDFTVSIKSKPEFCEQQKTIRALFGSTRMGKAVVGIRVPTTLTATKIEENLSLCPDRLANPPGFFCPNDKFDFRFNGNADIDGVQHPELLKVSEIVKAGFPVKIAGVWWPRCDKWRKLETIKIGDVDLIKSADGYHVADEVGFQFENFLPEDNLCAEESRQELRIGSCKFHDTREKIFSMNEEEDTWNISAVVIPE